jgi:AcrR family transcriptional regulator
MDATIVHAAIAEAEASGKPVAEVSLDSVARRAGVSRSTVFRRIRSRQALDEAVRAAGVDPGRREASVRERAITVATELIVADGVGAATVEEVARRVGCATTSVHTQFGGRDGLLTAVFERHAPLPVVERVIAADDWPPADFDAAVRAVYTEVFDALDADEGLGVIEALLAEALAKPEGEVMRLAREWVVPRITTTVGGWLMAEIEAGRCVDLPLSLLLPLLIAPIGIHLMVRRRMSAAGVDTPDRSAVIDTMTRSFCRAAGTGS